MLLSDILTHVRNEIDGVRTPDIILALNEFMRIHKLDKKVIFHLKEVIDGDSEITVLQKDGQILRSSFRYDRQIVEYDIILSDSGDSFVLPNSIMTLKRLWLNNSEIFSTLSTDPLFGLTGSKKYTIMPNNEVKFNAPLSLTDKIEGYASLVCPAYLYNQPETTEIPYNEGSYTCIVSYILFSLFKNQRYTDNDKASFYFGQYKSSLSSLYPNRSFYKENIGKL